KAQYPIDDHVRFPMQRVHMELTNVCNFDCVFCPSPIMQRAKGFMDFDLACRIIDEVVEERIAEKIVFHIMGEPTLHPRFYEIAQYAIDRGLTTTLTTNASTFTPTNIAKMIAALFQKVNISLHTPDETTYHLKVTGPLKYERFIQQISDYVSALYQAGGETELRMVLITSKPRPWGINFAEPIDIINTTDELHQALIRWTKHFYSLKGINENGEVDLDDVLQNIRRLSVARWNIVELYPRLFFETYVMDNWGNMLDPDREVVGTKVGWCDPIVNQMGVMWNGDVTLCCKDHEGLTAQGNLADGRIKDILSREAVIRIVNGFKRYRVVNEHCQRCLGGPTRLTSVARALGSILFTDILRERMIVRTQLFSTPADP
ncbi:MAG: radical SAM/SPASM domain-containing protein, partial [Nitrospinota bacterium]